MKLSFKLRFNKYRFSEIYDSEHRENNVDVSI